MESALLRIHKHVGPTVMGKWETSFQPVFMAVKRWRKIAVSITALLEKFSIKPEPLLPPPKFRLFFNFTSVWKNAQIKSRHFSIWEHNYGRRPPQTDIPQLKLGLLCCFFHLEFAPECFVFFYASPYEIYPIVFSPCQGVRLQ